MRLSEFSVLPLGSPVPDGVVDAGTSPSVATIDERLAAGRRVLVSLGASPDTPEEALLAAVSVYAWLGVAVFLVPAEHIDAVRQALDMVASIKGTRQPTLSRRGLA